MGCWQGSEPRALSGLESGTRPLGGLRSEPWTCRRLEGRTLAAWETWLWCGSKCSGESWSELGSDSRARGRLEGGALTEERIGSKL